MQCLEKASSCVNTLYICLFSRPNTFLLDYARFCHIERRMKIVRLFVDPRGANLIRCIFHVLEFTKINYNTKGGVLGNPLVTLSKAGQIARFP